MAFDGRRRRRFSGGARSAGSDRYAILVWRECDSRWFVLRTGFHFDELHDFAELMCGPEPWFQTVIAVVDGFVGAAEAAAVSLAPPVYQPGGKVLRSTEVR